MSTPFGEIPPLVFANSITRDGSYPQRISNIQAGKTNSCVGQCRARADRESTCLAKAAIFFFGLKQVVQEATNHLRVVGLMRSTPEAQHVAASALIETAARISTPTASTA
jgi:hypothetical protein